MKEISLKAGVIGLGASLVVLSGAGLALHEWKAGHEVYLHDRHCGEVAYAASTACQGATNYPKQQVEQGHVDRAYETLTFVGFAAGLVMVERSTTIILRPKAMSAF